MKLTLSMQRKNTSYTALLLLAAVLAIFAGRTALAARGPVLRLNDIFTAVTLVGSLALVIAQWRSLRGGDWAAALGVGAVVGATMPFATLFSPYPLFGVIDGSLAQAAARGATTALAALGGLVILRMGGPVPLRLASGQWKEVGRSLLLGLGVGLPLAVLNVAALQITQGQPIHWQRPLAAAVDALQPAVVEEVVYRFALLGLLWLALRGSFPKQAGMLAGLLSILIHTYMHYDELFLEAPLMALGMGLVVGLLWGVPPTILALRRDLDSAVSFHWIQDAARFLAGF